MSDSQLRCNNSLPRRNEADATKQVSRSHFPPLTSLSPTSLLNPFFGYPASSHKGFLSLQHGRRRKRDLARTLAVLFWIRWRKRIMTGVVVVLCALGLAMGKRAGHLRFLGPSWAISRFYPWNSAQDHFKGFRRSTPHLIGPEDSLILGACILESNVLWSSIEWLLAFPIVI